MTGNTETAPAPSRSGARAGGLARPLFLLTAASTTALDLASKAWAWKFVAEHERETMLREYWVTGSGLFRLVRYENTGTIWGLFQDHTSVLIWVRGAMVLGILALVWTARQGERLKLFALGLVLGGALGNLYDNLARPTRGVRDFLDFHIPLPWLERPYHYPTFNVADASILVGAVLLFFAFGAEPKPVAKPAAEGTAPERE